MRACAVRMQLLGSAAFLCILADSFAASCARAAFDGAAARAVSGARALALGEAYTALATGAGAAFWNPAGFAGVHAGEFAVQYRKLDALHTLQAGSMALRPWSERGVVLGASGLLLNRAGVRGGDALGGLPGQRGGTEFVGAVLAAIAPVPQVQLGGGIGRVLSTLGNHGTLAGWSASLGIRAQHRDTHVGVALRGVTSGLGDAAGTRPAIYTLSAGVAQVFENAVLLGLQLERERGARAAVGMGLEWMPRLGVAVRAGVRHDLDDTTRPDVYSSGFGIERDGLQLDYALRARDRAQPEHVVSIGFVFGETPLVDPLSRSGGRRAQGESNAPDEGPPPPSQAAGGTEDAAPQPEDTPDTPTAVATPDRSPDLRPVAQAPARRRDPELARRAESDAPVAAAPAPMRQPAERVSTWAAPPLRSRGEAPVADPFALQTDEPERGIANQDDVGVFSRPALATPSAILGRFVVRAGVYSDIDEAALEVARFYRAMMRPRLERRGELFVVVIERCDTRAAAEAWVARVQDAGLRCVVDEE